MPIAIKDSKIDITYEKATKELAKKFTKYLKGGEFIFLYGEMGVGKTTFVKYFINEFQNLNKLPQTEITSPTFSILNEYLIKKIKINHYDLFRLKSSAELKNLDLFSDRANSITIVEWPEIIKEKPQNLIELKFKYEKNYEKRSVQIKGLDLLFK